MDAGKENEELGVDVGGKLRVRMEVGKEEKRANESGDKVNVWD